MWKLVRDKIPDFSKEKDDDREFAVVKDKHLIKCLRLKLLEEAEEVLEASDRENLIEELADVFEVLKELMIREDISREDVRVIQCIKVFNKGGFKKGIIMKLGS